MQVQSPGGQDALKEETAAHSSCLENPMDRGAWWAIVRWGGSHSQTRLTGLCTHPGRTAAWTLEVASVQTEPRSPRCLERGKPPQGYCLELFGPQATLQCVLGVAMVGAAGAESSEEKHPF